MFELNKLWVVEWSESQQSFHIDTIEKMLKRNTSAFLSERKTDYKPLAFAESQDEAIELRKQLDRSHEE